MKNFKVILSGGGTGGHIFPALAIANALKALDASIEFLFVGAKGRMEMEKVPAAGYRIEGLWISGIQRRLSVSNLLFPFKVISSLFRSRQLINSFQPDLAIGTGGYASGPLLYSANRKGIPTLIQEQNSFPGVTNRILASKVNAICVAYEGMEKYFPKDKILLTGNPVRADISDLSSRRREALAFFGLEEDKKILLVIGGSLGARTINESIELSLPGLRNDNIQLVWQTGKAFYPRAKQCLATAGAMGMIAFDFISRMDLAYAAADAVVSRAGAISISELTQAGKASILVPSPNVAEDHQTKNTVALVNRNAAIMIRDSQAREKLGIEITLLLKNETRMKELRENISGMLLPDSANKIARECLRIMNLKRKGLLNA